MNRKRSRQENIVDIHGRGRGRGRGRKILKKDTCFSFNRGSRVLYATSLEKYSENTVPIMNLASAKVIECEKRKKDKEPHVNLEKDNLSFWVPYSSIYEILLEDKDPHKSLINQLIFPKLQTPITSLREFL